MPSWTSYSDKEQSIGDMIIYVDVACGDHETGLLQGEEQTSVQGTGKWDPTGGSSEGQRNSGKQADV